MSSKRIAVLLSSAVALASANGCATTIRIDPVTGKAEFVGDDEAVRTMKVVKVPPLSLEIEDAGLVLRIASQPVCVDPVYQGVASSCPRAALERASVRLSTGRQIKLTENAATTTVDDWKGAIRSLLGDTPVELLPFGRTQIKATAEAVWMVASDASETDQVAVAERFPRHGKSKGLMAAREQREREAAEKQAREAEEAARLRHIEEERARAEAEARIRAEFIGKLDEAAGRNDLDGIVALARKAPTQELQAMVSAKIDEALNAQEVKRVASPRIVMVEERLVEGAGEEAVVVLEIGEPVREVATQAGKTLVARFNGRPSDDPADFGGVLSLRWVPAKKLVPWSEERASAAEERSREQAEKAEQEQAAAQERAEKEKSYKELRQQVMTARGAKGAEAARQGEQVARDYCAIVEQRVEATKRFEKDCPEESQTNNEGDGIVSTTFERRCSRERMLRFAEADRQLRLKSAVKQRAFTAPAQKAWALGDEFHELYTEFLTATMERFCPESP